MLVLIAIYTKKSAIRIITMRLLRNSRLRIFIGSHIAREASEGFARLRVAGNEIKVGKKKKRKKQYEKREKKN